MQLLQPRLLDALKASVPGCAISIAFFPTAFLSSPAEKCQRENTFPGENVTAGMRNISLHSRRAEHAESVRWRKVGNYWHGLELTGC